MFFKHLSVRIEIKFLAYNENGEEEVPEKASEAVVNDSEEMELGNEDVLDEPTEKDSGEDGDSLSYFEELGVASMILENFKADGKKEKARKSFNNNIYLSVFTTFIL